MTPESQQTLGEFLKTLRTKSSRSLRDVEQGTGISNAYMSLLENDKIKKPSPANLHKLAEFFNVDLSQLLSIAGILGRSDVPARSTTEYVFSKANLSDEEEAALLKYLQFLRFGK